MRYANDMTVSRGGQQYNLQISQDGCVRMPLSVFMELPLAHFLSGLDDAPISQANECGTEVSISGYTEWLSSTMPKVTVGWDWRLDLSTGSPLYLREGFPRSNIMLIDAANGRDLGYEATDAGIALRIDLGGFSNDIGKYITSRYS